MPDTLVLSEAEQREADFNELCPTDTDKYSFAFSTANLYNLIDKNLDFTREYEQLVYFRNKLGTDFIELNNFEPDSFRVNLKDESIFSESRVYCSYHLGAYKHGLGYLVSKNVDLLVLIDRDFGDDEIKSMTKFVDNYQSKYRMDNYFEIMDISDNSFLFKLLRILRSGKSVFIYIDANKGNQKDGSEKLASINFFNKELLIRKGLAYISYASKVPIQPIITYRDAEDVVNIDFVEYQTPFHLKKEDFVQEVTQSMYTILEEYLRMYCAQWEWWLHIHHDFAPTKAKQKEDKTKKLNRKKEYLFNNKQYALMHFEKGSYILFDRESYQYYDVDSDFYQILLSFNGALSYDQVIQYLEEDNELFLNMLNKSILLEK